MKTTTLPNGMNVYHHCSANTQIIYNEIFRDRIYAMHGIDIRDGDIVFDVGANIGFFVLYVNSLGVRTRIFSFEPIPDNFELLKRNVERCTDQQLHLFNCGLADSPGEVNFTYYPLTSTSSTMFPDDSDQARNDSNSFIVSEIDRAPFGWLWRRTPRSFRLFVAERVRRYYQRSKLVKCPLRTIPQIVDEYSLDRIDLLKIDAEAAEFPIVSAMRPSDWEKVRQAIVEVHEGPEACERMRVLLEKNGFHVTVLQQSRLFPSFFLLYGRRHPHD